MSILTAPERLAKMMIDCNDDIVAAYHYTQAAIDQIERPCFIIFVEGAEYPQDTTDEEIVEQSYSIAYVGHAYSSPEDNDFSIEYEIQARQVAYDSVLYLLEHQQLSLENRRNLSVLSDGSLPSLDSILGLKINSRSAVTLFARDAVNEAFWGFTIDITVQEQLIYETAGY